ncbi:MAG: NUDIX domain-containing protein [Propioniciclava sp.]
MSPATVPQGHQQIVVRAYGVLIHPDEERFLVVGFADGDYRCHRLPGGKVEYLELSSAAMARELAEEFGLKVLAPVPIGVLENTSAEGAGAHDVIFVFAHRLETPLYPDEGGVFTDEGWTFDVGWRRFDAETPELYPVGIEEMLPLALAVT